MKQLKLTINGEVKTFDLPENGDYKCEVTESYVPKAGDCVMIESKANNVLCWCKLTDATTTYSAGFNLLINSNYETLKNGFFFINNNRIYTKITPEDLKAKYAEAGYDWDDATDTIKPIKWVPKDGDEVWFLHLCIKPASFIFNKNNDINEELLEKGLIFPTEEECQKFADYCLEFINNK